MSDSPPGTSSGPAAALGDTGLGDAEILAAAVRSLGRTSIMVIGDVMLDRYVFGPVHRISPEAPIPVITVERELAMPGGAGNVVRNLTALGAAVAFVSVEGDDQAGSDLTGLIGGQPGVEPWLLVQGSRATTVKTRYVSQGQQLLRADREETGPLHAKIVDRMMRIARDTLAATTVAVLSDYNKGVLAGTVPAQLIAAAHAAGRPIIVDPKGPDYSRYAGHKAKVKLLGALLGRKKFVGTIGNVAGDKISFVVEDGGEDSVEMTLALSEIERARLVPEL